MIDIFSVNPILNFFLILILNIFLFYLINFYLFKKKILIDIKKTSPHKKLISQEEVPVSGGIILLINCLIFSIFDNFINLILISSIFLIGFFADIQKLNSPLKRFIFQLFLILIFVIINDLFLRQVRITFIDQYLNYDLISILFTSFCLLILINGSNFIDGSNLQCSGYYFIILTILIYLDLNNLLVNNFEIINILYPFLLSFILFNYFNKSYFGDGGSYLLSVIIGYLIISLHISTNISPYFIVLILWYPAFENFFSIIRRVNSSSARPDQPDSLHLHHLLFTFLNKKFILNKNLSASLPSIIVNFFNFIIFYIGTHFLYSTVKLIMLILVCIVIYTFLYFLLLSQSKLKSINN